MPSFAGARSFTPTSLVATTWLVTAACTALGCDASEVTFKAEGECFWGAQFADCGGTGTPRFACKPMSLECAWFTGGVVAEGYLAWPCADGRICCEDGPDATYPHDMPYAPSTFFNVNGIEPWTRERALDLVVTIDPQVAGELSVRCERDGNPVDEFAPCRVPGDTNPMHPYSWAATMRDTLSVEVGQSEGFVNYSFLVEIFPGDVSEPVLARVCLRRESDGIAISCDPSDYYAAEPQCATVGDVSLSNMPSRNQADLTGLVVAGDVEFPNGLDVSFTVPL